MAAKKNIITDEEGDSLLSSSSSPLQSQTILIGLSGPSSSGKTTLARLLRSVFTVSPISLRVIHLDDFYKTDVDVPVLRVKSERYGEREVQDWDCVESLDLDLLAQTLEYVKANGELPEDMVSKEDQNSVGESGVSEAEVGNVKREIEEWLNGRSEHEEHGETKDEGKLKIWILDGFLLYPDPSLSRISQDEVPNQNGATSEELLARLSSILSKALSLKLFLPCTRSQTIARRTRRTGYVTLEGFWTDPPGYIEDVVWPNYMRDHMWMFATPAEGKVGEEAMDIDETEFDSRKIEKEHIEIAPGSGQLEMKDMLSWSVEKIQEVVSRKTNVS